jgi:hypothetical protein
MANEDFLNEIKELQKRYPSIAYNDIKTILRKTLPTDIKAKRTRYVLLAEKLDTLLNDMPAVSFVRFVKEYKNAWNRKYPDGIAKKNYTKSKYQAFLKEMLPQMKKDYPYESNMGRIRRVAALWKDKTDEPVDDDETEAEEEIEETQSVNELIVRTPIVKPKRRRC